MDEEKKEYQIQREINIRKIINYTNFKGELNGALLCVGLLVL